MGCVKCGNSKCQCIKVISKQGFSGKNGRPGKAGPPGATGPAGPSNFVVKDGGSGIANNVTEVRFTDATATVTNPSTGVAQVNFTPAATVWNNIQNLSWYVTGSENIRPQYTIIGNQIFFRGLLFIPIAGVDIANGNSYLTSPTAVTDDSRLSVISNAQTNNGTPQGRFMTISVSTLKNLPPEAIPTSRDIVFTNIPCNRRYTGGGYVTNYRSFVTIRIGCAVTPFVNTGIAGSGCIMVFSPFNEEYDGAGTPPLGNDPLALGISRANFDGTALNYIGALDDSPFSITAASGFNAFNVNAHHIQSLGGFIINLENLSGFLN